MRGYFGIGIQNVKTPENVGTLWRAAYSFGAAFIFTIGHRYHKQPSDTVHAVKHIPLFESKTFEEFKRMLPKDCMLIGVELDDKAMPIKTFPHFPRSVYLLGAEDHGLTKEARNNCHRLIYLPGLYCLNVATAGSIVMYDRITKDT